MVKELLIQTLHSILVKSILDFFHLQQKLQHLYIPFWLNLYAPPPLDGGKGAKSLYIPFWLNLYAYGFIKVYNGYFFTFHSG